MFVTAKSCACHVGPAAGHVPSAWPNTVMPRQEVSAQTHAPLERMSFPEMTISAEPSPSRSATVGYSKSVWEQWSGCV